MQEKATNAQSMPYKFTAKELDPETNLYYYGARYYDAQLSRWVSADKILNDYLPGRGSNNNSKLPGMGGVFNAINLNLYCYAANNPLRFTDPDGNVTVKVPLSDKYFYFQQKPRDAKGNFQGFRWGFTTKKEGRYIDPTAGSITGLGSQKISFNRGKDQKVSFETADMVESAVSKSGYCVNINSTIRPNDPSWSRHRSKQAVDINRIADNFEDLSKESSRVYKMYLSNNLDKILNLQDAFKEDSNNRENFGPSYHMKRFGYGQGHVPHYVGGHNDHLHESAQSPQ